MDFDAVAMNNIEDMEFSTVLLSGDWHEIDDECWFDCDRDDQESLDFLSLYANLFCAFFGL